MAMEFAATEWADLEHSPPHYEVVTAGALHISVYSLKKIEALVADFPTKFFQTTCRWPIANF
jgi:hypothetical protein